MKYDGDFHLACLRIIGPLQLSTFFFYNHFKKFIAKHKEGKVLLDNSDADDDDADIFGGLTGMSREYYVVSK